MVGASVYCDLDSLISLIHGLVSSFMIQGWKVEIGFFLDHLLVCDH